MREIYDAIKLGHSPGRCAKFRSPDERSEIRERHKRPDVRTRISLRSSGLHDTGRLTSLFDIARGRKCAARTRSYYIRPRDSGGGGPRVCAVEGASDSTLRCRRRSGVESRAPPTAPVRGLPPRCRGAGRNMRRCLTLWIGKERPRMKTRRGESRPGVGVVIHLADDAGHAGL
jgi:hypothetical protein